MEDRKSGDSGETGGPKARIRFIGGNVPFRHSVRAEEARFRLEPCARQVFGIYAAEEAMHRRKHDDLWMTHSDERINRSISLLPLVW